MRQLVAGIDVASLTIHKPTHTYMAIFIGTTPKHQLQTNIWGSPLGALYLMDDVS